MSRSADAANGGVLESARDHSINSGAGESLIDCADSLAPETQLSLPFAVRWSFCQREATFGEPVTAMELSPDGAGYRLNTRFARFINVPELMQMFRQAADVQTAQMLNLPRPTLENDKPAIRNAPATPELREFVQELAARADRLRTARVDPRVDNMAERHDR